METVEVTFHTRVRPSGSGKADADPIAGVRNTIAVASGKGGVGKSTVAANLAVALAKAGAKVGLLDADVYGPSIPLMMGQGAKPLVRGGKIVPLEAHGVKIMSIGFLLDPDKALIWRGPAGGAADHPVPERRPLGGSRLPGDRPAARAPATCSSR